MRSFVQAGGRFEVRGLRPGRWSFAVYVWSDGVRRGSRWSAPEDRAAGVHEIELVLEPRR
jgi:hypothetical protein